MSDSWLHRFPARLGGTVEGIDRPRLPERIGASEQRLLDTADRPAEIVGLKAVRVDRGDHHMLDLVAALQEDPGHTDVPRPGDPQRALRAEHLERLSERQLERAVA